MWDDLLEVPDHLQLPTPKILQDVIPGQFEDAEETENMEQ